MPTQSKANPKLLRQIAGLQVLSLNELKALWQTLCDTKPPRAAQKPALIKKLSYRLQALAYGEDDTLNQRLEEYAKQFFTRNGAPPKRPRYIRPMPGSRLVRQYKGHEYCVTVLDKGYEYDGCVYKSLSKITKRITGNHWSGVAFFGLNRAKGMRG